MVRISTSYEQLAVPRNWNTSLSSSTTTSSGPETTSITQQTPTPAPTSTTSSATMSANYVTVSPLPSPKLLPATTTQLPTTISNAPSTPPQAPLTLGGHSVEKPQTKPTGLSLGNYSVEKLVTPPPSSVGQTLAPPQPAPAPPFLAASAPTPPSVQSINDAQANAGFDAVDDLHAYMLQQLKVNDLGQFEMVIGLYLQDSGRTPHQVTGSLDTLLPRYYLPDMRRLDLIEQGPQHDQGQWVLPAQTDRELITLLREVRRPTMEGAIRVWAHEMPHRIGPVLNRAGWYERLERRPEWYTVDEVLKMEEGEEKEKKMAAARKESPRFFEQCANNLLCGMKQYRKRHIRTDDDDPNYEYQSEYTVRLFRQIGCNAARHITPTSPPKRRIMNHGPGQPTQVHGVPIEERAIDSKGNLLPWAIVFGDGHPNARGQKRHPEEKGPFGKSTRRKGSSRTRTVTPSKKENPTIDGFEQALKYDAQRAAESKRDSNTSAGAQDDRSAAQRQGPSHIKEPTQIVVYGYASSRQYAAIDRYEKCSLGMICEDYEREPPSEMQKYPNNFSSDRPVHTRPLTKQEKALAFKYDGGNHWIKLTCDSAEAAARAVEQSPLPIYGHWVYAELWNGRAPEADEPILMTDGQPHRAPRDGRGAQTLGAAFSQHAGQQMRATSTLPRSFNPNAMSQAAIQAANGDGTASPSTASSATATGVGYPDLRNRHPPQGEDDALAAARDEIIPGVPRYVLRPPNEAFLPQPTWWERQLQWLREQGLVPTDFIGDRLPMLDNGEFDWVNASWYWRLCYWFDCHLGTDICGLKEE